jgi:hypothetical protein
VTDTEVIPPPPKWSFSFEVVVYPGQEIPLEKEEDILHALDKNLFDIMPTCAAPSLSVHFHNH